MTESAPTLHMTNSPNNIILDTSVVIYNLSSILRIFPTLTTQLTKSTPVSFEIDDEEVPQTQPIVPFTNYTPESSFAVDLLTILLKEICWDLTILTDEEMQIKAHKNVLISRCQYFARIFSGESNNEDVIALDGYMFRTVHFAICHLYAGTIEVPKCVNLEDLADLAAKLRSDGISASLDDALARRYCHDFHEPCSTCKVSGLECLRLTHSTENDMFSTVLEWIRKYIEIFKSGIAQFELPDNVVEMVFKEYHPELNKDNIMENLAMFATILNNKNVSEMVATFAVVKQFIKYIACNLNAVVCSNAFLKLKENTVKHLSPIVSNCLLLGAERASVKDAIRAYDKLDDLTDDRMHKMWINLNSELSVICEKVLIKSVLLNKQRPQWVVEAKILKPSVKQHIADLLSAVRAYTDFRLVRNRKKTMTVREETDIIVNAVDICNAKKKDDRLKKKRRSQDQTKTKHAPKTTVIYRNESFIYKKTVFTAQVKNTKSLGKVVTTTAVKSLSKVATAASALSRTKAPQIVKLNKKSRIPVPIVGKASKNATTASALSLTKAPQIVKLNKKSRIPVPIVRKAKSYQRNPPNYDEIILNLCSGIETLHITDSNVGVAQSHQDNSPNYEEIILNLCNGIETLNITDSDVGVRPGTSGFQHSIQSSSAKVVQKSPHEKKY